MSPDYALTCPHCGGALEVVASPNPASAPWLCPLCRLGWHAAELSSRARLLYRSTHRDFGHGAPGRTIREQVHAELEAAAKRGTSLREDQVHLAPTRSGARDVLGNVAPAVRADVAPVFIVPPVFGRSNPPEENR